VHSGGMVKTADVLVEFVIPYLG